jgi:hypothetical protein
MPGLPRAKDETRPREAFAMLVLSPVEHLTTALRRGDAFSEQALADMMALQRRLAAFSDALDARLQLVEDE